ncbi:hypothetical protein SAMN05660226_02352 [Parapedobacter luteus]|uniref:AAA domain-containing protein n=1 Tax=Parapedobacter luteus TaxID=623280 RepID=A0A1T5CUG2_9SPHI|nr:AAA family ATPase [Parapedobacter luteus]SKB63007.1 hypothetical protein SAMN05660226_02352 [Parapedobacter luteus]
MLFENSISADVADTFWQLGGKVLYIDEVHKYPEWAREIKNIYDFNRDIRLIFTGSSVTDLLRQTGDLSRRAALYELPGLSYREYLYFAGIAQLAPVTLEDILAKHLSIAGDITATLRPLKAFADYLNHGYYPFFKEGLRQFPFKLENVVKMIIETDLQHIEGFDPHNVRKMYQLLYILATNVPFKPNISKLSEKTGIHRNTLIQYLQHLERARLIHALYAAGRSISTLQKPEKIYLENANLHFALAPQHVDKGSLREAFFVNQLRHARHRVSLPAKGDFLVDERWTFEVGGKNKTMDQLAGVQDAYIAADDMESGVLRKIPLWLFGFLY